MDYMDYRKNYLKYKRKYLDLKTNRYLKGGNIDAHIIEFIKKFYTGNAEIFRYFQDKYRKNPEENLEEFALFCLPSIKVLLQFLYDKLSEESKAKPEITIFSYATGTGIVEALFGLYLKVNYHKKIQLFYIEPLDRIDILKSYGIFDELINIIENIINSRISIINSEMLENENSRLLDKLIKLKIYNFDIFITNNPQGYIYNTEFNIDFTMQYEDYMKQPLQPGIPRIHRESFDLKKRNNNNLKLIIDIFKYFTKSEQIPMIWLIWHSNLDLSSPITIETSLRKILTLPKLQEQWQIPPHLVISTVDKIHEIFKIP